MPKPNGLPVAKEWYRVAAVSDGISQIIEKHVVPWMRCNIFLIRGRSSSLLLDSGMGFRPIRNEIETLRDIHIKCVCTHCHFDHTGCVHEFDVRLGHALEAQIHAEPDPDSTCARAWLSEEIITALPNDGFEIANYRLTPAPLTGYLDEGDVIDLGNRAFQVLHLPGHSPGSIALYEKSTKTLFSGDAIYDGDLVDNAWHSDAEAFRESLRRLRELPVETIHAGHFPSFGRQRLLELIDLYFAGTISIGDVHAWKAAKSDT